MFATLERIESLFFTKEQELVLDWLVRWDAARTEREPMTIFEIVDLMPWRIFRTFQDLDSWQTNMVVSRYYSMVKREQRK